MNSPNLCIRCKGGKNLCGAGQCPLLGKIRAQTELKSISKDFYGPVTSVFVGRHGYPNVFIGPMAAVGEKGLVEQKNWFGTDYSGILEITSMILRSKTREHIRSKGRTVEMNQELVLAKRPTDVEMYFHKKPVYSFSFSDVNHPLGPSASLEKLRITENVPVPRGVDRIVSDDLKAGDSSFMLFKEKQDVYKIAAILSSGVLGMERGKKLVPTRWSITAVDDIITKRLLEEVRNFPSINDFLVFESRYLDNNFQVLLMPGSWEYEGFEAWAPGSFWSSDMKCAQITEEYEPFQGRKKYADRQGGGYYAARFGVVEHLHKIRRQARAIVFREIYEGYVIPVGVWQVRQNVRNAFKNKPRKFPDMSSALGHIGTKLRIPVSEYRKSSRLLRQRRLSDFQKVN